MLCKLAPRGKPDSESAYLCLSGSIFVDTSRVACRFRRHHVVPAVIMTFFAVWDQPSRLPLFPKSAIFDQQSYAEPHPNEATFGQKIGIWGLINTPGPHFSILVDVSGFPTSGHPMFIRPFDQPPWSFWERPTCQLDSPFCSTIVLLKNLMFPLRFWWFPKKKDPWKEWRSCP